MLLVTGGRLGDIFGRRLVFLIGVVVFAIASALIGVSPSEGTLIAFRALQGAGAALMMPATLSVVANAFPPSERGKAIGTWAGVSAIALALGPLVGGWLTEDVTWRAIFFINVPVAVIAIAVTLFATHESRDETATRQVDYPGIAALTIGLTSLVLALVEGNAWGWGSAQIITLFALAILGLAAFGLIERRSAAPIVNFDFFRSRSFLGANIVAFAISFGMFAVFFFLALYMQNILGYSPLETGVRFLPSTLVIMVAGPLAGRALRQDRSAHATRDRPAVRDREPGVAEPHRGRHLLRVPGHPVHLAGPGHGLHDEPDEHGRDERGGPHEGGCRVRHAEHDPHGRRHVRCRRARRAGEPHRDRPGLRGRAQHAMTIAAAATLLAAVAAFFLVDPRTPEHEPPAPAAPEAAMV